MKKKTVVLATIEGQEFSEEEVALINEKLFFDVEAVYTKVSLVGLNGNTSVPSHMLFAPIDQATPDHIFIKEDGFPVAIALRMGWYFPYPRPDQRPHGPGPDDGPVIWVLVKTDTGFVIS